MAPVKWNLFQSYQLIQFTFPSGHRYSSSILTSFGIDSGEWRKWDYGENGHEGEDLERLVEINSQKKLNNAGGEIWSYFS